ncbi:MAG: zinc-binding dehydrogenase [Elusimicrobia bacterium]|nr:zinc-binding dehydrogenase [Elusimicrobiota bacterium]
MRTVIFREHGATDKLEFAADFPEPQISDDEILVRVKACSLNHLDIWVREGLPGLRLPLPHISGCDISGEVAKAGGKISRWKEGDPVVVAPGLSCWNCSFCRSGADNLCAGYGIIGENIHGGLAEFVKVKEYQLLPKPANLSFEEAASFPLTFLTAWHMLVHHAKIGPGKSTAILGAGSGIGTAALQIARLTGAGPILAMASTEEKLAKAKSLGADHLVLTGRGEAKVSFHKDVLKATAGQGVDIVFEHIGPATMESSVKSLKKGGVIVTCGATTGPKAEIDLRYFFMKDIRLQGSIMGTFKEMETIVRLMADGKLKPVVDSVFPLEETRQAQEKLLSRDFFGKIIVKV